MEALALRSREEPVHAVADKDVTELVLGVSVQTQSRTMADKAAHVEQIESVVESFYGGQRSDCPRPEDRTNDGRTVAVARGSRQHVESALR